MGLPFRLFVWMCLVGKLGKLGKLGTQPMAAYGELIIDN